MKIHPIGNHILTEVLPDDYGSGLLHLPASLEHAGEKVSYNKWTQTGENKLHEGYSTQDTSMPLTVRVLAVGGEVKGIEEDWILQVWADKVQELGYYDEDTRQLVIPASEAIGYRLLKYEPEHPVYRNLKKNRGEVT